MTKTEMIGTLDRAAAIYGADSQIMMMLEEMSELSKELLKNINRGKDNIEDIAGEIADVGILLEQMKNIYEISDEKIDEIMDYKIRRLEKKLGDRELADHRASYIE
jgi:NTP pyrophosphatase (non-canonical NTP hydrolase)